MQVAQKPGEGSALTREVLKEFAGLHHQLTEVHGVKVRRQFRIGGKGGREGAWVEGSGAAFQEASWKLLFRISKQGIMEYEGKAISMILTSHLNAAELVLKLILDMLLGDTFSSPS